MQSDPSEFKKVSRWGLQRKEVTGMAGEDFGGWQMADCWNVFCTRTRCELGAESGLE